VIHLMSALKRSRAQETPAKGGGANKQEKRTKARLDRRQPSLLLPVAGGGKGKEETDVGRTAIAEGRRKKA
jgi:hypothetical protein